ncbi:MAG TPA: hypothetical protein VG498_22255 [Terriglobales bacterium]|nr:hypothetical protein [Terriglobales bacterium]
MNRPSRIKRYGKLEIVLYGELQPKLPVIIARRGCYAPSTVQQSDHHSNWWTAGVGAVEHLAYQRRATGVGLSSDFHINKNGTDAKQQLPHRDHGIPHAFAGNFYIAIK